jgi:DNA-binding NtrC family response regulator
MATILIVEDDAALKELLLDIFHEYEIYLAKNSNEAKYIYQTEKIDVLIADIILEKDSIYSDSGLDVIIDFNKKQPDSKILAISGGGGLTRAETLLSSAKFLGASEILKKPFTPDEILSTVESLIQK